MVGEFAKKMSTKLGLERGEELLRKFEEFGDSVLKKKHDHKPQSEIHSGMGKLRDVKTADGGMRKLDQIVKQKTT